MTSYRNRVGVVTHTNLPGGPYADLGAVQAALDWLGVTRVRDRGTRALTGLTGIDVHVVCGTGPEAARAVAAGATSVEGPNEPNGGKNWPGPTHAAYDAILTAVAGAVPVLCPAMNQARDYSDAGQFAADIGNVHCYQSGQPFEKFAARIATARDGQRGMVGYRRWWATETGWHDDTSPGAMSQADAAAAIIPALTAFWAAGAERVYLYQLFDQPGLAGMEAHFGLFTPDGQPKPVAVALRDWIATYGTLDDLAALTLAPQLATMQDQLAVAQTATATALDRVTAATDALTSLTTAATSATTDLSAAVVTAHHALT